MAQKDSVAPEVKYRQYVVVAADPDACWGWTGAVTSKGHPHFGASGTHFYAHRYSYEANIGPVPDGLWVLHHCDNPPCTNPAHLYAGTPTDNARDRERRGRGNKNPLRGEQHSTAKLTEEKVLQIIQRYRAGGIFQYELAAEYGVHQSIVSEIVNGKRWKHVQGALS